MIATAAEAIVDLTPVEEGGELRGFRHHLGGSPFNVAVGVARLGRPAAFLGRLSTDLFGEMFRERLASSGASDRLAAPSPSPSSLAFVRWRGADAEYSFHFAGTASTELVAGDVPRAELDRLRAYHFGSLALSFAPVGHAMIELARAVKGRALVSFDPNVRPAVVADWDAYRALARRCLALADVVKLSDEDAATLGVDPASLVGGEGPVVAIVTGGARGSRVHTRAGVRTVPAAPCRVVDTMGAGDAYTSGILVGLDERGALDRDTVLALDGPAWDAVARFAATCAALACEREGPDLPLRADVDRRLDAGQRGQ